MIKSSRVLKRSTFDLYADQIDALRKLAEQEAAAGRSLSTSRLVRDAIDDYIQKHRKK